MKLIEFSIRQPFFILVFWTCVVIFGIKSYLNLPVSFLRPDQFTHVAVSIAYPGAAKDRVLEKITKPLEVRLSQNEDISNIVAITSDEKMEMTIDFKKMLPEAHAVSSVLLEISAASQAFPKEVQPPIIRTEGSYQYPLFSIAVSSSLSHSNFYDIIHSKIKPAIEELPDIYEMRITGIGQKQATVRLDLEKMKEREITATEIISRFKTMGNNIYIQDDKSYLCLGRYTHLDDVEKLSLNFLSNDQAVFLNDIATIKEEPIEPTSYAYYNGSPCLILDIYQMQGGDTKYLVTEIPEKFKQFKEDLSDANFSFNILSNREENLTPLVEDFYKNIGIAVLAAIAIIMIVFRDLNSIAVSISSIPLSLCGSFCILSFLDIQLSIYTILAFILSIGLIIDDVIIIRESIFRYLESGMSPFAATRKALGEMLGPIIGTTSMILSAAFAMIVVPKTEVSQYLTDFGVTLFSCMFFSLLEALTLAPILCAYCSKRKDKKARSNFTQKLGEKIIHLLTSYPRPIFICFIIVILLGCIATPFMRTETNPHVLSTHIEFKKNFVDSSLDKTNQDALSFAKKIYQKYPEINSLGVRVERDQETFYLQLPEKSNTTPSEVSLWLQKELQKEVLNGQIINYNLWDTVIPHTFYSPPFSIELTSTDSEILKSYAKRLFLLLKKSKKFNNLVNTGDILKKESFIIFDQTKMNRLGVEITPTARELSVLFNGYETNSIYAPFQANDALKKEIKIHKMEAEQNWLETASVANMNSKLIPLKEFATLSTSLAQRDIRTKNQDKLVEINGMADPMNPKINPIAITEKIIQEKLPLPSNISMHWAGGAKNVKTTGQTQNSLNFLSLFFIYLTLILLYQSLIFPFLILAPLPFSFIGSLLALAITGNTINSFSMMGFVIAIAIAAKNGVILLHYTKQLISQGLSPLEAVYGALQVRLRPILMTAIAVLLTTIPILIPWNPYSKLQFSLGVAILGGLLTSTIVSLLIIPILFQHSYRGYLWVRSHVIKLFNENDSK